MLETEKVGKKQQPTLKYKGLRRKIQPKLKNMRDKFKISGAEYNGIKHV